MSNSAPYLRDLSQFDAALQGTLDTLGGTDFDFIRHLISSANLASVGTGGTSPVATLAAQAHIDATGRSARSLSPLLFLQESSPPMEEVVLIFSAQARHRDTEAVVASARRSNRKVVLVTQRSAAELGKPFDEALLVHIPTVEKRDGFLATKSLISMAGVIWKLYGDEERFGHLKLDWPSTPSIVKDRLLVTFGRDERAAAEDIEVRFSELGLADVQLADYRTLAHGRHLGLSRRLDETTLIALSSPLSAGISSRTLQALPESLEIIRLSTQKQGLLGAIELLAATAALPVRSSERQGLSLTKPSVPLFGRKLYHLRTGSTIHHDTYGPVSRKLLSMGIHPGEHSMNDVVRMAYGSWRSAVVRQRFDTLVLDYDGTTVTTTGRFEMPSELIRQEIIRLLREGARFWFASGRGDSLRASLERWIPEDLQSRVQLGLHNGQWLSGLGVAGCPEPTRDLLAGAREPLEELGVRLGAEVRMRSTPTQITFQSESVGLSVKALRAMVQSRIETLEGVADLQAVSSAHSVDVISGKGKTTVLEGIALERAILIGDQGQEGGNDHDLLKASRWSFTVDASSSALDRCWSVSPKAPGPESTSWLLKRLQPATGGFKLSLPADRG